MDPPNKSELLKTLDTQQEKIKKYESKFRDLIVAYKSLSSEKEALEASVNALSVLQPTPIQGAAKESTSGDPASSDPLNVAASLDEAHIQQMKEQIFTLTTSLSTLTQEKTKLQANYQADKKKFMQEHEDIIERHEEEKKKLEAKINELQSEIQEWRNRVRLAQHELEKEQNDHAVMLRELQKLVAEERTAKEQLENQVDELRLALINREKQTEISESYEKRIKKLSQELESVRWQLKEAEEKAIKSLPLLHRLEEEVAELKASHRIAIQQACHRANDAEEKVKLTAQQGESRVSELEAKLSELSEVVGNYERLRYQDQSTIQKFRERIAQLDLENTALARAAHHTVEAYDVEEGSGDVQTLVDRIISLKGMLKLVNEKSDRPINIEELLQDGDLSAIQGDKVHKKCQEDYEKLKEEFERYKLRAQSVLKTKTSKEATPSQEVDNLKGQNADLKERLRTLRVDYDEMEAKHKEKITNLHKTLMSLEKTHVHEMATLEQGYKQKMADLEQEIRRHRDRTIALLSEKNKEIEILRARSPEKYENQYMSTFRRISSQNSEESLDMQGVHHPSGTAPGEPQTLDETAVNELLYHSSMQTGAHADTSILHFAHEQARKDVEINSLRKQKHTMEMTLRQLQQNFSCKEQKYIDDIEELKEDIHKLERNQSRESANLEYLKNVVYHYMVCRDHTGKQQMLKAIATILQFSPKEKDAVQQILLGGWWYHSPTKKK